MTQHGDGVAAQPGAVTLGTHTVEEVIRHRLATAIGGWHGAIESALPTLAFLGVWLWRDDLKPALLASGAVIAVEFVVRLVLRSTTRYLWGAVIATALAAFFSLRSGKAEDAFLPGILINSAYAVLSVVSIALRAPLVGFLAAVGDPDFAQDPLGWRRQRGLVKVASRLTWILAALYLIRVAVFLPLYLAGDVATLGLMKLLLGWPLYVAAIGLGVWMLVKGRTVAEPELAAELADPVPGAAEAPGTGSTAPGQHGDVAGSAGAEEPSHPGPLTRRAAKASRRGSR